MDNSSAVSVACSGGDAHRWIADDGAKASVAAGRADSVMAADRDFMVDTFDIVRGDCYEVEDEEVIDQKWISDFFIFNVEVIYCRYCIPVPYLRIRHFYSTYQAASI